RWGGGASIEMGTNVAGGRGYDDDCVRYASLLAGIKEPVDHGAAGNGMHGFALIRVHAFTQSAGQDERYGIWHGQPSG
ncbi:MAG: hypothetical protein FWC40_03530, partial [Proteobacteria bacterium]|nr:hypothetical protein [Pseudomonadota bacterium]